MFRYVQMFEDMHLLGCCKDLQVFSVVFPSFWNHIHPYPTAGEQEYMKWLFNQLEGPARTLRIYGATVLYITMWQKNAKELNKHSETFICCSPSGYIVGYFSETKLKVQEVQEKIGAVKAANFFGNAVLRSMSMAGRTEMTVQWWMLGGPFFLRREVPGRRIDDWNDWCLVLKYQGSKQRLTDGDVC